MVCKKMLERLELELLTSDRRKMIRREAEGMVKRVWYLLSDGDDFLGTKALPYLYSSGLPPRQFEAWARLSFLDAYVPS